MFCVRDDNGEEVSDSNCSDDEKPSNKQSCNSQPCPARLVHGYRIGLDGRKGNLGGAVHLVHLEKRTEWGTEGGGGGGNRDTGKRVKWGREEFGIPRYFKTKVSCNFISRVYYKTIFSRLI